VWGLDAGDMNGDGLTDVIVTSNSASASILYFENTFDDVSISFAPVSTQNTNGNTRNIRIGDLNADGKPDIAFTDASITESTGQFNYIINDLCMTPVITPASGVFCNGSEFILRATGGEGLTYTWDVTDGGGPVPVADTDNEIDLNSLGGLTGSISVSVNAAVVGSTFCNSGGDSDPAGFTTGSAGEGQPSITNPGVVCFGDNFTLNSPTTGLANYYWSGPNGFSESTTVPTVEVSENATYENSGTYTLIVDDGDCLSPERTIDIVISGPPVTTIESSSCDDGSITLEVPDFSDQFTYQWKRGATNVGTDNPSHTDTQVGTYTLDIEDGNSCIYTTEAFEIYTSTFTGPSFGATNEVCIDVTTTFTSGQTGTGITNSWEVVDPLMSVTSFSGDMLETTFGTVGTWEVHLNSTYSSAAAGGVGIGCTSKTITVSDLPTYAIEANSVDNTGPITKCPSEDLTLSFSEVGTGDIQTVSWDSLGTVVSSNTLLINEPGTYNATYVTNTGCEETVSLEVINHPDLGLAAADPEGVFTNVITDGQVELGDGQLSVTLSVDGDVTSPDWSIVADGGNATIEANGTSLLVTPRTPTVTIQVTGTTTEGCDETEQL
ncbi:MAG: VCBS repeat-containing protein, partial [Cyclobacteriaceae bacterium]